MAEKDSGRVITIPLRKEWLKQPRVRRVNRSVHVIREYLFRHLKGDEVKLSRGVNELLWASGAKSPPARIKIAVEVKEGVAFARLPNEQVEVKKDKKGGKEKKEKAEEKQKPESLQKDVKNDLKKDEHKEPEVKKEKQELTPGEKEAEKIWKEAEQAVREKK